MPLLLWLSVTIELHELDKKRKYDKRIHEVERETLILTFDFSSSAGMDPTAAVVFNFNF